MADSNQTSAPSPNKVPELLTIFLMVILFVGLIGFVVQKRSWRKEVTNLQNQLALSAKTVQEKDGLYEKLTVQTTDLQGLLNSKDAQIRALEQQVKSDRGQLVSVSQAVTTWKKAYEGLATASQTGIPSSTNQPTAEGRVKVEFQKDFGYIGVSGYTLTNPAEAYVRVQQNRPLKITVATAQAKDGSWRTYTTSSEENVAVDIEMAGVNPFVLEPKWYEGLELQGQLGVSGQGLLGGAGLGVKISNFTVGPNVWGVLDPTPKAFFGMNLSWRPFERK